MATFIEPFAYGTNLASFRTTHVVNDAYTSTLADSFTDTYSTSSSPSPCTPPVLFAISSNSDYILDSGTRPR
jgi:hypothetical protein